MTVALTVLAIMTVVAVVVAARAWQDASHARARLEHLDDVDHLTGLAGRGQLRERIEALIADSSRTASRFAVIAIEVQRFDYLNTTYGHETGDALLVAAGRTLVEHTRTDELLARHNGPQFVVVVPQAADPAAAARRAEALVESLGHPYQIGDDRIRLAVNGGVIVTDQVTGSVEEIMLDLHVALQHAIEDGPGAVSMFDASMHDRFAPSVAEHRLREALEHDEFGLRYLPMIDLRDGRVVGAEALLRWEDPETGVVSPRRFLRSLDETGLIVPVGGWAIEQACRQARSWQDVLPSVPFEVWVNISPRQLLQSDFTDRLREIVATSGVDTSHLCLEITEGALMGDVEAAWAILREVKSLGIKLALDDFGTGSSSLGYLRRFRVDSLKIDQVFVASITDSREDEAIVQQLVGLAHALGMRAVAEGVESAEQVVTLRNLGCDLAQGYQLASPQSAEVMEEILTRGRLDGVELALPDEGTAGGPPPDATD
jgi:diguanylate cyclase (GGDEF)-like protein